jgi:gamma-glutamyltranspeptidase/glutathione hydrolase
VQNHPTPGDLTLADLASYRPKQRAPLCGPYRQWQVCGMGAPSSGGVAVLQLLGMLARFQLNTLPPTSADAVHLYSEAGRLAFADRERYLADPDFVAVPQAGLIAPDYLAARSQLIDQPKNGGAFKRSYHLFKCSTIFS